MYLLNDPILIHCTVLTMTMVHDVFLLNELCVCLCLQIHSRTLAAFHVFVPAFAYANNPSRELCCVNSRRVGCDARGLVVLCECFKDRRHLCIISPLCVSCFVGVTIYLCVCLLVWVCTCVLNGLLEGVSDLLAHSLTYLLTYLLICLLAYLLTHSLSYLLIYLFTYFVS